MKFNNGFANGERRSYYEPGLSPPATDSPRTGAPCMTPSSLRTLQQLSWTEQQIRFPFSTQQPGAWKPVYDRGQPIGQIFEDEDALYCILSEIRPSNLTASRGEQTEEVFAIIQRALQQLGLEFRSVVRTWFYVDQILDWYGEFNRVRTLFFKGIEMDLMPASTGIGAPNCYGAALFANVIAVLPKSRAVSAKIGVSPLQGEAAAYGSSFSRAIELQNGKARTLYISGTASIDSVGNTLHIGDVAKQIETTMEVVEAMLSHADMGMKEVTRGIAYLKNAEDVPHWSQYCERRGWNDLPVIVIHADVCRDELLFEIELDAAKP